MAFDEAVRGLFYRELADLLHILAEILLVAEKKTLVCAFICPILHVEILIEILIALPLFLQDLLLTFIVRASLILRVLEDALLHILCEHAPASPPAKHYALLHEGVIFFFYLKHFGGFL